MQTLHERDTDLSVIIPVYNLEKYLTPILITLKDQDAADYNVEIIFVLNNCTDESEKVIRLSGIDCTIMNCEIQGCGPARNAALEIAHGEYVWFIDGDDCLLSTTAFRDVLDRMKRDGLSIIRIPFASEKFRWPYFSMVWQYVIRRDFIGDVRFPNYQPAEDDAFMETLLGKAGYNRWNYMNMPSMDAPLYFYNYLREGSNMYRYTILGEKI